MKKRHEHVWSVTSKCVICLAPRCNQMNKQVTLDHDPYGLSSKRCSNIAITGGKCRIHRPKVKV